MSVTAGSKSSICRVTHSHDRENNIGDETVEAKKIRARKRRSYRRAGVASRPGVAGAVAAGGIFAQRLGVADKRIFDDFVLVRVVQVVAAHVPAELQ